MGILEEFNAPKVFKTSGIREISYSSTTFSRNICLECESFSSCDLSSYIFNLHAKCNLKKCLVKTWRVSLCSSYIMNAILKRKKNNYVLLAYTVPREMSGKVNSIWSNVFQMLFNFGFHELIQLVELNSLRIAHRRKDNVLTRLLKLKKKSYNRLTRRNKKQRHFTGSFCHWSKEFLKKIIYIHRVFYNSNINT